VFLYAPPLGLSGLLWARFRRSHPGPGMFLALAWGIALAFNGTWWAWHGGWCWGPRLMVPLIPLSCLPLGMLPDARGWRWGAVFLVAAGIAVQVCAVNVDLTPHHAEVFTTSASPYHRINWVPAESPLVAAVTRLARGQSEPLAMFHLKSLGLPASWWVGLPLALTAGGAIGLVRLAAMLRGRG
jgi:hypothetical protein